MVLNIRRVQCLQFLAEQLSHGFGILSHVFIFQHAERGHGYFAGQRAATIGRAVLTWFDVQHNRHHRPVQPIRAMFLR